MPSSQDLNEIITEVGVSVSKIIDDALRPIADRLEVLESRVPPSVTSKKGTRVAKSNSVKQDASFLGAKGKQVSHSSTTSTSGNGSSRDIKADILEAAVELFYRRGFEATGVQEIVDRAGCTKGALYHYFRSKDEVLFELRNEFISALLQRGREILSETHTATEALGLIIRELIMLVSQRRPYMAVAFLETRIDFERQPKAGADRNEWKRILTELIVRGQSNNEFRPEIDVTVAVAHVAMCSWAAFHWLPEETALHPEVVVAEFTAVTLRGLACGD